MKLLRKIKAKYNTGQKNWRCNNSRTNFERFSSKELLSIIDEGKKEIKSGIVVGISTFENKVGLAVGITKDLTSKYDAIDLVKAASVILGGKGGGGRKDFAQAGGVDKDKIKEAFKEISKKIS